MRDGQKHGKILVRKMNGKWTDFFDKLNEWMVKNMAN